ncbi:MAG TPA: pyridoxamine 5'-phosphate oxidase family protein [Phenylobacterium sp.]|nr:pyridoxamine 5'-phosphate oxidase family protein [Phenylobacterium sp.]
MNIDINDLVAVERQLWDEIERHDTGMLGVTGDAGRHAQPMTAFPEPERKQIWFFARTDSELARQVGDGAPAMFVYQQKDLQACIDGHLSVQRDPARVSKYWNAVVAAWYPGGKDDPKLTMLCLDCDDARVWISQAGPAKFAWEIAKAHATKHAPDIGGRANLDFH